MDRRSDLELDGPATQFVTEADWIPGFWNYLLDLDRDDLIAELIQNDLDQDATRTVISFEQDHVVCEGNGRPVEPEGWQRLRKIQGAGDSVPAKRGKIGVKNHGLKTAFTIGDEIRLLSEGQAITQTLYAKGRDEPPYPGASPHPLPDPEAPVVGCRIIIRYRDAPIEPRQGEATVLGAVTPEEIDALFLAACASAPEQFAGIASPEVAPRYEIVLRHWRLGEARFTFSCTQPRGIGGSIELFRRRCSVSGTVSALPPALQEQAARRLTPLRGRLRNRVADFFRRGNRFFVEVSWPIDGRGRPGTGTGRFRYPIGYPQDSHEARTGHGVYFNAPIASDNKRHGPARNEATNKDLRAACEALLVDVLARHAIPRWGPDGLNPLVPSPGADNKDEAVRPLLASLAGRNAMPTLKWREAMELLAKSKKAKIPATLRRSAGWDGGTVAGRYRFVVPSATWMETRIHSALSILSPPSERQIHPGIDSAVLRLLADGDTHGFGSQFVTFDEDDAFRRATEEPNKWFDAPLDVKRAFAHPFIGRAYLDLINEAMAQGECDDETEEALLSSLLLPDVHGNPARLDTLHTSATVPSDVPGLRLPPILHADLAAHPLFRRQKWRRPKYTMARFLASETLEAADEHTKRLFWKWLNQNQPRIAPQDRSKLADIPVWPDQGGNLRRLASLCEPRSQRMAEALAGSILRPHEQVRRSKLVSAGTRGRTSIRRLPTQDEIRHWLDQRMAAFIVGEGLDDSTFAELRRFEADLALLLKDASIARMLKAAHVAIPALAQDGSIRLRTDLVTPGRDIGRLALRGRFLLKDRQHAAALDKLSASLRAPTADMLLETFSEDAANFEALQARLQQFLNITQPGGDERRRLADMAVIPVNGEPRAPATLAFVSAKGDYWGTWKTRLSGKGLSQEDQSRYRSAGVTSGVPDLETSQAFFGWLSGQPEHVLQRHISCALRQILHPSGPTSWASVFTDTAWIPARSRDGLRLVSLRDTQRRPIYLPDTDVAEVILKHDPGVLLVIDHVKEVTHPATELLRNLGIRSLREALKEPESVSGTGETYAGAAVIERLQGLRSPDFRRTFPKRLAKLGIETDVVRHDWYERLSRIEAVCFADNVEAKYRFRHRLYPVPADAGFDPASGTFWMKKGRDVEIRSLYEAIAAQLVFKPSARPVDWLALERALDVEIRDPSYGRPQNTLPGTENEDQTGDTEDLDTHVQARDEEGDDETDPGEAIFGHSPFVPDDSRNIPKPAPISAQPTNPSRPRSRPDGPTRAASRNGESDPAPAPALEIEHIENLKRSHYASHCQICLCERSPKELAPVGSYIEWEEVRRRVVEAHHVDLKSANGARHAGNLILLCKLHHDNYGRRLTRAAITAALRGQTTATTIRFGADGPSVSEVMGRVVMLVIPDTGEVVRMFFTREHAAYWLTTAPTNQSQS